MPSRRFERRAHPSTACASPSLLRRAGTQFADAWDRHGLSTAAGGCAPLLVEVTAAAHYLWAMLLMELLAIRLGYQKTIAKSLIMACIYEALPLVCPICQGQMRIIAFITDAGTVRKLLDHLAESAQPPRIAPARGPPQWEAAMAREHAGNDPQWDSAAQSEPKFESDQRIVWCQHFLLTSGRLVRCVWNSIG